MDNLELVARYIAARRMGLVKDPYGHRLPIDIWTQCEGQAADLLKLYSKDRLMEIINLTIHP